MFFTIKCLAKLLETHTASVVALFNSFLAIDEISRQLRENASPPMTRFSVFSAIPLLSTIHHFRNLYNPEVLPSDKLLHVRVCFKDRSEWELYEKSVTIMELSLLFAQNVLFFHLVYCMFIYLKKNIFWKALNFGENHEKRWRWLATFLKNAGGERVKDASGPEWDSFSALEFHALDRPTLVHD